MAAGDEERVITVSAVVLRDEAGRWVTVRKRGTASFMHPGGKPEPGESARGAAVREVAEELGLDLDPDLVEDLGTFVTATANEPGFDLHAHVFAGDCPGDPTARAEIEELRWVDPADLAGMDESGCAPWAPLLVRVARTSSGEGARPGRVAPVTTAESSPTRAT